MCNFRIIRCGKNVFKLSTKHRTNGGMSWVQVSNDDTKPHPSVYNRYLPTHRAAHFTLLTHTQFLKDQSVTGELSQLSTGPINTN